MQRLLDLRDGSDEVLIVKDGLITDVSIGNVALHDGVEWFTPRKPLLAGTMRRRLLEEGRIKERDIRPTELRHYERLSIINAMLDLGRCLVDVDRIQQQSA